MHKTYRRRQGGVSFRLVTAVAAVAMLATSAIAGTAFAADETGGDRIIRGAIQADSPDPGMVSGAGAAGSALFVVLSLFVAGAGVATYMKSRNARNAMRD